MDSAIAMLSALEAELERDVRLASTRDQHIRASSRLLTVQQVIHELTAGTPRTTPAGS